MANERALSIDKLTKALEDALAGLDVQGPVRVEVSSAVGDQTVTVKVPGR